MEGMHGATKVPGGTREARMGLNGTEYCGDQTNLREGTKHIQSYGLVTQHGLMLSSIYVSC
jgi:hypothetical protein